MSSQLPTPAASNIFERIKRVNTEGHESWSARDLARVLEYLNFRNFEPVIQKAKEACAQSSHAVGDHFAEMRNMVSIRTKATAHCNAIRRTHGACWIYSSRRRSEPTGVRSAMPHDSGCVVSLASYHNLPKPSSAEK